MHERLIEKVRQHEGLYNPRVPTYRDLHIRQRIWEKIGKELGIPGKKAKEQWDKLRRCLCNARNRRRDENMLNKKKAFWKYEKQMSFVIPFMESRKPQGILNESPVVINFETEQEDASYGIELEENPGRKCEIKEEFDLESEQDMQDDKTDDEFNHTDLVNKFNHEAEVEGNRKRQHTDDNLVDNQGDNFLAKDKKGGKCVCTKSTKLASSFEMMDDTDMFFLSMSRMTKKLPKIEQANIKLELSKAVLLAEIRSNER